MKNSKKKILILAIIICCLVAGLLLLLSKREIKFKTLELSSETKELVYCETCLEKYKSDIINEKVRVWESKEYIDNENVDFTFTINEDGTGLLVDNITKNELLFKDFNLDTLYYNFEYYLANDYIAYALDKRGELYMITIDINDLQNTKLELIPTEHNVTNFVDIAVNPVSLGVYFYDFNVVVLCDDNKLYVPLENRLYDDNIHLYDDYIIYSDNTISYKNHMIVDKNNNPYKFKNIILPSSLSKISGYETRVMFISEDDEVILIDNDKVKVSKTDLYELVNNNGTITLKFYLAKKEVFNSYGYDSVINLY